jgi:hypothetical protein
MRFLINFFIEFYFNFIIDIVASGLYIYSSLK